MQHKHRLMLAAACGALMAAAGETGSDTGGTGTGAAAPPAAPSPAPEPAKAVKKTPVRVLADSIHGKVNDVVHLADADLKAAIAQGHVDPDKAAVAYAAALPQNQPKPKKAEA